MKVIYLGAKLHRISLSGFEFFYNDIVAYPGIDYVCDMLDVDLDKFDIVIATPSFNYYSRVNAFYKTSKIFQLTKHLLPDIIDKCIKLSKPFLIENTYSKRVPHNKGCMMFTYGSHVFYTNVLMPLGFLPPYRSMGIQTNLRYGNRDNNPNVHYVINLFLLSLLS